MQHSCRVLGSKLGDTVPFSFICDLRDLQLTRQSTVEPHMFRSRTLASGFLFQLVRDVRAFVVVNFGLGFHALAFQFSRCKIWVLRQLIPRL